MVMVVIVKNAIVSVEVDEVLVKESIVVVSESIELRV